MTIDATRPAAGLDLGQVLQTTFGCLGRNLAVLAGLAALCVGLPEALLGLVLTYSPTTTASSSNVVSTIAQCILQGAVVHAVVTDLNGRRPGFNECLAVGGKVFLPLWGVSLLSGLGVIAGLIVFIVPGLILACMWAVASPARVIEGPGVRRALGRSRALTQGYRWPIFVLVLILAVLVIGGSAMVGLFADTLGLVGNVIIGPGFLAFAGLVGSTGSAVLYTELRRLKEGAGPDNLASVFD